MRHIRKFNEASEQETDQDMHDILESLTEVSDRLGKPNANKFKMGSETGYVVQYDIPIATIGEMTTGAFYEAVDALYSTKEDVLQTADRFADRFQTTLSQTAGKLKIRFTPTKKQQDGYKFIVKAEGEFGSWDIDISKSELRRWAMDNGLTLTKVKQDDDGYADRTGLLIKFSGKPKGLVELLRLEKEAMERELGELYIEIGYSDDDENTVWLSPDDEEIYIYGV